MTAFNQGKPATLIALTMAVIIPKGAIVKRMLSAQPVDSLRKCFATCSPKSERIGARSLKRLFVNSSPLSALAPEIINDIMPRIAILELI
jgi:hypothetical protein